MKGAAAGVWFIHEVVEVRDENGVKIVGCFNVKHGPRFPFGD